MTRQLVALSLWIVAIVTCLWKTPYHFRQIGAARTGGRKAWHLSCAAFWIGWLVIITFMLSR